MSITISDNQHANHMQVEYLLSHDEKIESTIVQYQVYFFDIFGEIFMDETYFHEIEFVTNRCSFNITSVTIVYPEIKNEWREIYIFHIRLARIRYGIVLTKALYAKLSIGNG